MVVIHWYSIKKNLKSERDITKLSLELQNATSLLVVWFSNEGECWEKLLGSQDLGQTISLAINFY